MGSVILSLDAELAWGFHHLDQLPGEMVQSTRRTWRKLCRLFDEYEIPATWAIIGHLLRDSCDERHREHPAGERICNTASDKLPAHRLWFDDGLVDEIANADVDHEVASHGYTHVHFDHDSMNRAFAARELTAAADSLHERGFDTTSFVFPVNSVGYRDLLAASGFDCYRGVNPAEKTHDVRRKLTKITSATTGVPAPPVVEPQRDEHGLVNIPASLYLFNLQGVVRSVLSKTGTDPVVRQAVAGIDRAAKSDGVFHMWLHPHNVRRAEDEARIVSILEYISRRRETHDLQVETMSSVAERVP